MKILKTEGTVNYFGSEPLKRVALKIYNCALLSDRQDYIVITQ